MCRMTSLEGCVIPNTSSVAGFSITQTFPLAPYKTLVTGGEVAGAALLPTSDSEAAAHDRTRYRTSGSAVRPSAPSVTFKPCQSHSNGF